MPSNRLSIVDKPHSTKFTFVMLHMEIINNSQRSVSRFSCAQYNDIENAES